jgi:VanZ family protein
VLMFPWVPPRWAQIALVCAAAAILVLALIPQPEVPLSTSWDKLDHWLAFFTLAVLADHAFPRQPFWRRIALGLLAYGIGIEVLQSFTPDRQADLMDVVADSIGFIIYGILRQLLGALIRPARAE